MECRRNHFFQLDVLRAAAILLRYARDPVALAAALLLLATVPSSFLVQWNARRLDATYEVSMWPLSAPVVEYDRRLKYQVPTARFSTT